MITRTRRATLAAVVVVALTGLVSDATLTDVTIVPGSVSSDADMRLLAAGANGLRVLLPVRRTTAGLYARIADIGSGEANTGPTVVSSTPLVNAADGSAQPAMDADAANLDPPGGREIASGGLTVSDTENAALANASFVRIGGATTGATGWARRGGLGPRSRHTAVWTGSEMIVWGGTDDWFSDANAGGRYNPAGNNWTAIHNTGARVPSDGHTAVWTGSEMLVWGGFPNHTSNTGWRYNPMANTWTPMATTGAPARRVDHTAVWADNEMIVWGGRDPVVGGAGSLDDGARYDPAGDRWTTVSPTGAPGARGSHTAVWTGSEMIVWGGRGRGEFGFGKWDDGARYDPAGDRWTAVSPTGALGERSSHTAVWTGSEMIVWGGEGEFGVGEWNTGSRYRPVANTWTAVNTTGAPTTRWGHTAVWTGSEMIVWGGGLYQGFLNDGGRYRPVANTWTAVSPTGAPSERTRHTAVWTGSEMIVWGGEIERYDSAYRLNDGGRYSPAGNRWMAAPGGVVARVEHTTVWTGSEMIVWGGESYDLPSLKDGGRYHPSTEDWTAVTTVGAPAARYGHTAVWTGSEMIIWGGYNSGAGPFTLNDGGRYHPAVNSWTPISTTSAPGGRADHTAVWTGSEMIVWGGSSDDALADGGRYDPVVNRWTALNTTGAPTARWGHTAVWTGNEMIVWGGTPDFSGGLNTGGRYHPEGDSWTAVSTTGAPTARRSHTAVWTGNEMIVWGGGLLLGSLSDGGRYRPEENGWTSVSTTGAPAARFHHTAVWTGSEMIIWGGTPDFVSALNDGDRYSPAGNSWTPVSFTGEPAPRWDHTAVWTGSEMIVWGGWDGTDFFHDTSSYTPDHSVFDVTRVIRSDGALTLSFPTMTRRTYTLWRSDTLADGTWTNTGLPALTGNEFTRSFTVPASAAVGLNGFFRVHADLSP